jgi:two-component system chemotaxis response regulator CheB
VSEASPKTPGEIKVLVIDDSAFNRQTITSMLETVQGIRVVARAGDGDEGLKQVFTHSPDVITLDLEMPKMDGFTFLRILMSRRPTPVIVISSYARRENVFKALELGALDFIAKPTQRISPELREIERELVEKVLLVTKLRMVSLTDRAARTTPIPAPPAEATPAPTEVKKLVAIGASTGGPPALQQVFAALDGSAPMCVVVAQHMPARFTQAFAERLDRASSMEIREAKSGILTLHRDADGNVRVKIDPPEPGDRFIPSVDKLFESVAETYGADALGVILTGMAGDGSRGARAIRRRGGRIIAEAEETAVIFGMPEEAIRIGAVDEVIPLPQIAPAILRRVRGA